MRITQKEFEDWLEKKGVKAAPCPACGSDNVGVHVHVDDSDNNCVSEMIFSGSGQFLAFPDCRLLCGNCGLIRSFSAKIISGEVPL